jgi:acyl-CoA thioesterase-1
MKKRFVFFIAAASVLLFSGSIITHKISGTVVCFGDSITHGAKVDGHSWVYFLSKEHSEVNFVNEGRNGRKASDREEILPVLKKYPHAEMFLIFLGVNDLKDGNDSLVNSCVENMRWMIRQVRENNRRTNIVILSPTQIDLRHMSPLNVKKLYNSNTERSLISLEKRYNRLAREDSVGFISLLNAVSPTNYVDGLHPNEAGQREIARAVWRGLVRLVR